MKHIWSILCRNAIVDKDTNNVSLLDVIERIIFTPKQKLAENKKLPTPVVEELTLVSSWFSEKKERNVEMLVELHTPSKKQIKIFEKVFSFPENKKRMRTFVKIRGLGFKKSGDYFFLIKQKDEQRYKLVAEIPLEIKIEF